MWVKAALSLSRPSLCAGNFPVPPFVADRAHFEPLSPQKRRAKSEGEEPLPPQLPSFSKILLRNPLRAQDFTDQLFSPSQWNQDFTEYPGEGVCQLPLVSCPLPDRGAIRLSCPPYGTSLLASGSKLVARCLSGWQLAAGSCGSFFLTPDTWYLNSYRSISTNDSPL